MLLLAVILCLSSLASATPPPAACRDNVTRFQTGSSATICWAPCVPKEDMEQQISAKLNMHVHDTFYNF